MMISHIKAWRNGDFATFNDMNKAIMEDCSAWKIQMDYGEEYSGIVRKMVYRRHRKGILRSV